MIPSLPQAGVFPNAIVSTRRFAASPALLWQAWSEPELLARWWGPDGFTNSFAEFDFRPGGDWRFVMHGPNGTDYPNYCRFVDIVPAERIILDHVTAPVFRITATFTEELDGTRLVFRMQFDDPETCAAVARYAVPCNEQNFDRLEAVLAGLGEAGHA